VLLPDLSDTGFTMDPLPQHGREPIEAAARVARSHGIWMQVGHAARDASGNRLFNVASVVRPDGSVAGAYRKVHLFSPGGEDRHYAPGDSVTLVDVHADDGTWRVAPMICYDLRFPEVWRHAALAGAELFSLSANWPSRRHAHWAALVRARAIENQAFVACCNRVGRDPQLEYGGGSALIDPLGEAIALGDDRVCALVSVARRGTIESWRRDFGALRDVQPRFLGGAHAAP